MHKDAVNFLEEVASVYDPDEIIQIGDLIDVHAVSRHEADPDGLSAGDELQAAINSLKPLAQLFPEMTITMGNHDVRYHKAAYRAGIPSAALRDFSELIGAKGWHGVQDIIIDDVLYSHGSAYSGATAHVKCAMNNMRSSVIGHIHTVFGVEYFANRDKLIFGACAGCLIDHRAYAMAYAKEYTKKSILGSMIIEDGVVVKPIPMLLSASGNWTGRV
jgi:hypothetical protein